MKNNSKKLIFVTPSYTKTRSKGYEVVINQWIKILRPYYTIEVVSLDDSDPCTPCDYPISYYRSSKSRMFTNLLGALLRWQPLQTSLYYNTKAARKVTALDRFQNTQYIFCTIRTHKLSRYVKQSKKYLLAVDSMELNFKGKYQNQKNIFMRLLLQLEYHLLKKCENKIVSEYKKSVFVADRDVLHVGAINAIEVPLAVDLVTLPKMTNNDAAFTAAISGNFRYSPNVNAVNYIIQNVLPILPKHIQIQIIGFAASQFSPYAKAYPNLIIKNDVACMKEALSKIDVAIAPMQDGSGMQYKILDSMTLGIPVITNTFGLGSIKARNGYSIMLYETPKQLVDILEIFRKNCKFRRELGLRGRKVVEEYYSTAAITKKLLSIFE